MRILFSPEPVAGGTQPSPAAPETPSAPVVQPTPAQLPTINLPVDQYTRLIDLERQSVVAREAAEAKARELEAKALAAAVGEGEAKTKLDEYTARASQREAALESQLRNTQATVAVAEAMAGIAFADDFAREDARTLLAGRVVVEKDGNGNYVALDRDTRRPAAETLRAELAGPRFARFRAATHQGGGGGGGGPAPTNPNSPPGNGPELSDVERRKSMFAPIVAARGGLPSGRSMANPFGHERRN